MQYSLRRSDRDLVALTVLALLLHGPSHTYEMQRLIADTHKDFVTGLPRSMYHAVDRLLRDELIAEEGTGRDGNRPERTVYRLTDEGRSELASRVHRLLATPDPDRTLFVAALSYLGALTPDRARQALGERVAALTGTAATVESTLDSLRPRLPRVLLLKLEYQLAQAEAELDHTRKLLSELDGGGLDWPADPAELVIPGEQPRRGRP